MQEPVEEEPPPQGRSAEAAAPSGEVTAIDETTMKEEDLQEAVGLLTQLEVRAQSAPNLRFPVTQPKASRPSWSRPCDGCHDTVQWAGIASS